MNPHSFAKPLLVIPLVLLLTTCSTVPDKRVIPANITNAPTPSDINYALAKMATQAPASSSDYQVGPEDLLQVTLFNIPESEGRVTPRVVSARVSQQGVVALPLLGEISIKGMTVSSLEKTLRDSYDKYIYNPQVGVLVMEYRQRVSVMGAVSKPGVFDLSGPKSVVDMLAIAGGLTDKAGAQVHLYRQGPDGRQSFIIDLLAIAAGASNPGLGAPSLLNMPLQGGDVINVPPAGTFFLDGAVAKPGAYPLGRRFSLTQALATAGGVDFEVADYSNITIFRRHNSSEVETIDVNLNEILAGRASDPAVETEDVIVVPVSGFKYFVKRFVGQLFTGFSLGSLAAGS